MSNRPSSRCRPGSPRAPRRRASWRTRWSLARCWGPIAIDWEAACYDDPERWDPDYRLCSHYDVRERALDWTVYVSGDPQRRAGVSRWTIIEPLLSMESDDRVAFALSQLSEAEDVSQEVAPAAVMLERSRVAALLQGYLASRTGSGAG